MPRFDQHRRVATATVTGPSDARRSRLIDFQGVASFGSVSAKTVTGVDLRKSYNTKATPLRFRSASSRACGKARPTTSADQSLFTFHPFDAPWLELVESLMLACFELVEKLRAGFSRFTCFRDV
jgi:hypothetical protein